jgi:hypothetical protein
LIGERAAFEAQVDNRSRNLPLPYKSLDSLATAQDALAIGDDVLGELALHHRVLPVERWPG